MKSMLRKYALGFAIISFVLCSVAFADDNSVEEVPDVKIIINGKMASNENVPISINSRTLLPLREILVKLGVKNDNEHINWNDKEHSVTIKNNNSVVKLILDDYKIKINDKMTDMDVCPVMYNDRTYIPARFVAQSFGMKVAWDEYSQTIAICSEENYDSVKKILTENQKIFSESKNYKYEQTLKYSSIYNIGETEKKSVMDTTSAFAVNNKDKVCSGSVSVTKDFEDKKSKTEMEIWFEKDNLYIKQKPVNTWQESILTDEKLANQKKMAFDLFYFISPTDFNCTAIINAQADDKEIVLKGEIFPSEIKQLLLENGGVTDEQLKTFIGNGNIEIYVNKNNKMVKTVFVKSEKNTVFGKYSAKVNYDIAWNVSDINGDFEVKAPVENNDISKADSLVQNGKSEEALEIYNEILKSDSNNYDANFGVAIAQYNLRNYNDSIKTLDKCISLDKTDETSLIWKAKDYNGLEEYEKAISLCDEALDINDKSGYAYNVKSRSQSYLEKYDEAIKSINMAIRLNEKYEDAYANKVRILYEMNDYKGCISFAKEAQQKFPKNYDIPWYMGDSYASLEDYANSVTELEKVIELLPTNSYAYSDLGWACFCNDNLEKAEKYSKKAIEINSSNESAKNLGLAISQKKLPEAERIVKFVKDSYLYADKVDKFDEKSAKFVAKKDVTAKDITDYIESIKQKDDIFTYTITGDDFDKYMEFDKANHLFTKEVKSNLYYVGISSFTSLIGDEFNKFARDLTNSKDATIVIDLRDNTGGLLKTSNEILDCLLPKCTTSYLINREGDINAFYSDEAKIDFKKIYVLVNENSASSSELLALGLKKYLNNVTIIGKPTFGKGVGQDIYMNKEGKYVIYLVNFYWNVKEQNIMGSKITPDVLVSGDKLEDYWKFIN